MKTTQTQIPCGAQVKIVELDKDYLFENEYRPAGNWRKSDIDPMDIADIFTNPYVEVTVIKAIYEELIVIKIPVTGAKYVIYVINRYVVKDVVRTNVWKLEL